MKKLKLTVKVKHPGSDLFELPSGKTELRNVESLSVSFPSFTYRLGNSCLKSQYKGKSGFSIYKKIIPKAVFESLAPVQLSFNVVYKETKTYEHFETQHEMHTVPYYFSKSRWTSGRIPEETHKTKQLVTVGIKSGTDPLLAELSENIDDFATKYMTCTRNDVKHLAAQHKILLVCHVNKHKNKEKTYELLRELSPDERLRALQTLALKFSPQYSFEILFPNYTLKELTKFCNILPSMAIPRAMEAAASFHIKVEFVSHCKFLAVVRGCETSSFILSVMDEEKATVEDALFFIRNKLPEKVKNYDYKFCFRGNIQLRVSDFNVLGAAAWVILDDKEKLASLKKSTLMLTPQLPDYLPSAVATTRHCSSYSTELDNQTVVVWPISPGESIKPTD